MADLKDMLSALKPYVLKWIHGTAGMLGWVEVSWLNPAYASATTVTLDGDQTGICKNGLRVRYKQTTYKYGTLGVNSTYNAGTGKTTITFIANSDYSVANAAISEMQITYMTPVDWPGWFNWTATFTGFSADPTNVISRFCVNGRTVHFWHKENTNGTSNATTFTISLPVQAYDHASIGGSQWTGACGYAVDNSAGINNARWSIQDAASVIDLYPSSTSANWTNSGGKRVYLEGFYEI